MRVLIIILCLFFSSLSLANDGRKFLQGCKAFLSMQDGKQVSDLEWANAHYCIGFVQGTIEMYHMSGSNVLNLCLPEIINNEDSIRTTVKFMEDNPQLLHLDSGDMFLVALKYNYGCDTK